MRKRLAANFSWKFLFTLFFAVWTTLLLCSSGVIESEDGWLYLSVAKNIYYRHAIESAPNEYPLLNVHMNTTQGADGKWRTTGALGYSLAQVPAVAASDLVHRILGTPPSSHFPLEHDWTLHFFASMTNSFWATILTIILILYAHSIFQDKQRALLIGLLSLFATNLLPLAKESFAHILFTTAVVGCFYTVRSLILTKKLKYLVGLTVAAILVAVAYNVSYYLPIVPLIVYAYLLTPTSKRRRFHQIAGALVLMSLYWLLPFVWSMLPVLHVNPKVFAEGVVGLLFSPGKSIFLYSPLLLIPWIFWHKARREYFPEYVSFALLSGMYLFFFSNAAIPYVNGDLAPIWHGGMDWGPRYLSTLIPFGMLTFGMILPSLSRKEKWLTVYPFLVASLWIQLVAISIPYLLQYRDIPNSIQIGANEFSVYDYASFIPRFSPLYIMSKEFVHRIKDFRKTIDHGPYTVKFYDGFEVPHFTGLGPFRGFRTQGHISFIVPEGTSLETMHFSLYNSQEFPESSSSAIIAFRLNDTQIASASVQASGNADTTLSIPPALLLPGKNRLDLFASYPATKSAAQVVYIRTLKMNESPVNLETLDYPDVATGGRSPVETSYQYFGNVQADNWKLWYLRARITERTFDFWWIKNLYYWDKPQRALAIACMILVGISGGTWALIAYQLRKTRGNP